MWLKAPENMPSVSAGGKEYTVESGLVEVPDDVSKELLDHGLTVGNAPAAKKPDGTDDKGKGTKDKEPANAGGDDAKGKA